MKLQTKLTLFNTLSKLLIVVLFVLLLPKLINNINSAYVDSRLIKQKNKLLQMVKRDGIDSYIQNGEAYSRYLPLKEEYISMDTTAAGYFDDTIDNQKRLVEGDTIEYRILSHSFVIGKQNYLLEIGKSVNTINETSSPLQSIALQVLLGMIMLTIMADFLFSNYILRPLDLIIKTKLIGNKFPSFTTFEKVKTSTSDFQYLDQSIHTMIETIENAFQKEREFISNASHELMTPISILQSKIENTFDSDDISDDIRDRLVEMQRILNRLKAITKTLLLISQIENEQFLKDDHILLNDVLQEVYDEISIRLQEKDIALNIAVPKNLMLTAVNKFLMFNLFFNLINNAVKYNKPSGSIDITAQQQDDGLWRVYITDTGIGIDAAQLPHIFNRFKKLKQSLQQDSFGLGLPIVRSIADFHHITIVVESEYGVGSRFILCFDADAKII